MNANTAIRTPMLFNSVEANVYSWKGLTGRENYEEYLIHIYSKNYFKICKEHPEILTEEVHIFKLSINTNEPLVNFKQCPLIRPIIKTDNQLGT